MGALKHGLVSAAGALMRGISPGRLMVPNGQVFDIPPGMDDYSRCALFAGRYERLEIALLKQWFREDSTIIEVGSNIGVVARYAFLEKLKAGGTYICVEPNPRSLPALRANMKRAEASRPGRHVQIVAAAVSGRAEEGGTVPFTVRQDLGSSLTASPVPSWREETIVQVPLRTLSGLLREFAPGGASLISDVEGAEIPMILDDPDAFAQVRQIVMELHEPALTGRPETPDFLIAALGRLGFVVRARLGHCCYFDR